MINRFPIHIHRREENGQIIFRATTSLEKLADAPDQIQNQLNDLADAYARALNTARAALEAARRDPRERPRNYWRVGQAICDFENQTASVGFYLAAQTNTFARDLAIHHGSLRKILAFHRRFADLNAIDPKLSWTKFREKTR